MKREQIIEILKESFEHTNEGCLGIIADKILALPLDVPSDKELDDEAFSRRYQKNNEFDAMYADAFIYGADWMKNEIIKRNTKK